jgi:hypothetical protein
MAEQHKITCDGCGADLTSTGNCVDYRLALRNESMPTRGGFVTAMGKYPAMDNNAHFCGLACLDLWTDRRRHYDALMSKWWEAWKDEHGTKSADGRITSYPGSPPADRDERIAEFEAAALAAFPMENPLRMRRKV